MTAVALSAVPPGTVAVQLREKDLDAGELLALARQLRLICGRYSSRLIVNDRIDVAIAAHADGVHLPAKSFAVGDARSLIGDAGLIGVSTHDDADAISAAQSGADFVVYGPVFDPLSKESYTTARGADGLIAATRAASIPVFALGGITADRVREIGVAIATEDARGKATSNRMRQLESDHAMREVDTGVRAISNKGERVTRLAGIAVIGSIFDSTDPAAAMRDLVSALVSW
jgi:thiamine-phosphate pyrophosphorylase